MNERIFKVKTKLLKKSKIYEQINIKEINTKNDPTNNLFRGRKKTYENYLKKVKKDDISNQISSLSYLLSEYTKKSKKNLKLINELKTENDYLLSGLDNNLQKSELFNKKTDEVFHDLIVQYSNKGYKIPNLDRSHNLFKRTPLLIENKEDVDVYYQDDPTTKGNFITDINDFKEKNWVFLNKLNKECRKAKTFFSAKHLSMFSNRKNSNDLKAQNNPFEIKKNEDIINNLLEEIDKLKEAIKKEEEKNLIFSYNSKYKRNNYNRKLSQSINAFNIFNNSNRLINKKKFSLINNNPNKRKLSEFNLITEVNKNKKNLINKNNKENISNIFSEEESNKYKKLKIPGSEKLKKEIKLYFSKNDKKNLFGKLKKSSADIFEKIRDIKKKIKKKDILRIHNDYFNFSRAHNEKIKKIRLLEKKICNLDKVFIKQTIGKSFEDT